LCTVRSYGDRRGDGCSPVRSGSVQPFPTRANTMEAFAAHVSRGRSRRSRHSASTSSSDDEKDRSSGTPSTTAGSSTATATAVCSTSGTGTPRSSRPCETRSNATRSTSGTTISCRAGRQSLAARLAATTGDRCSGVVLSPSGSEAVEVAIKTVRAVSGRDGIVSVHGAYHGHTALAAMAADARYHEPFRLALPGFTHVAYDDLGAMEGAIGDDTAAVVLETVPATLGCRFRATAISPVSSPSVETAARISCSTRCRRAWGGAGNVVSRVRRRRARRGGHGQGDGRGVYPIAATMMTPELHRLYNDEPFAHVSSSGFGHRLRHRAEGPRPRGGAGVPRSRRGGRASPREGARTGEVRGSQRGLFMASSGQTRARESSRPRHASTPASSPCSRTTTPR